MWIKQKKAKTRNVGKRLSCRVITSKYITAYKTLTTISTYDKPPQDASKMKC